MLKLDLNQEMVNRAHNAASKITNAFTWLFDGYTTVAIERTVLRLMGIDGALKDGKPLPNVVVDHLVENSAISKGAAIWVANAMLNKRLTAQEIAEEVAYKGLDLSQIPLASGDAIFETLTPLTDKMLAQITSQKHKREELLSKYQPRPKPAIYVIVATGNIYEDVVQARSAAREGADAIAVIRSTAQSLLDYVPFGATTVGLVALLPPGKFQDYAQSSG
jgi:beta-lysine 5,6-aminomutase alpha subunit